MPLSPAHPRMGFLWVEIELVEHSVLYFAGQVPRRPALSLEGKDAQPKIVTPGDGSSESAGPPVRASDRAGLSEAAPAPLAGLTPWVVGEVEKMTTRHILESILHTYRNRSDGLCVLDPGEVPAWLIKNIVMSNADLFCAQDTTGAKGSGSSRGNGAGAQDAVSLYEELCSCLLTLHRSDIRDAVDDVSAMYNASSLHSGCSGSSPWEDTAQVSTPPPSYPFPSALAYTGLLAYRSSLLDYPPDSAGSRRNSAVSTSVAQGPTQPPSRALYDCVPLSVGVDADGCVASTIQRAYNASIVTTSGRVYPFQWPDEVSYLTWMRVLSQHMRESCGGPFSQQLRSSYFDQMDRSAAFSSSGVSTNKGKGGPFDVAEFKIIPSRGVLECTRMEPERIHAHQGGNFSQSSPTHAPAQFVLSLSEIDHITTDCTFDYTRRYLVEIDVVDLSVSGFRPGGEELAIVTVTTSSGDVDYAQFYYRDLHTVGRRQPVSSLASGAGSASLAHHVIGKEAAPRSQQQSSKKMTMKIFISADSLTQADDVLIALHMCSDVDGIRTLGERRVTLLDLVGESTLPKLSDEVLLSGCDRTDNAARTALSGESCSLTPDCLATEAATPLPAVNGPTSTYSTSSSDSPSMSPTPAPSSYLTGVVAVEPKKLNKASLARATAAANAALQSTATELCMNLQTTRTLPLQTPRDALM